MANQVLGSIYDPRYYAGNVFDPDGYSLEFVFKSWQHPKPKSKSKPSRAKAPRPRLRKAEGKHKQRKTAG